MAWNTHLKIATARKRREKETAAATTVAAHSHGITAHPTWLPRQELVIQALLEEKGRHRPRPPRAQPRSERPRHWPVIPPPDLPASNRRGRSSDTSPTDRVRRPGANSPAFPMLPANQRNTPPLSSR
jgi:hypothetical protein